MPDRPSDRALWAYVLPFAVFLGFLALTSALHKLGLTAPELWVYPVQTIACLGLLWHFRREYPWNFSAGGLVVGAGVGLAALVIWIAPQAFFHAAPRVGEGFNPEPLRGTGWYAATVAARFVRLVVAVPILEEIFWRGFVLRYLVKENFTAVPIGTYTALSFWGVTVGFMLEHSTPDWPAAFITGALFNLVAVRTRSLPACMLVHAVTNLLLGVYVMHTAQWGFW